MASPPVISDFVKGKGAREGSRFPLPSSISHDKKTTVKTMSNDKETKLEEGEYRHDGRGEVEDVPSTTNRHHRPDSPMEEMFAPRHYLPRIDETFKEMIEEEHINSVSRSSSDILEVERPRMEPMDSFRRQGGGADEEQAQAVMPPKGSSEPKEERSFGLSRLKESTLMISLRWTPSLERAISLRIRATAAAFDRMRGATSDAPAERFGAQTPRRCSLWYSTHQQVVGWTHNVLSERFSVPVMMHAAKHPIVYIVLILAFTLGIALSAYLTGALRTASDQEYLLAKDAYPEVQRAWIDRTFVVLKPTVVLIHASGDNVLTTEGIRQAWEINRVISNVRGYAEVCRQGCPLQSVTNFWSSEEAFEQELEEGGLQSILETVSSHTFIDGSVVDRRSIFGGLETNDDESRVTLAQSLRTSLLIPSEKPEAESFEDSLVSAIAQADKDKRESIHFEVYSYGSTQAEIDRAIANDMKLVVVSGTVMILYCAFILVRCRANTKGQWLVSSNGLLGVGAALTSLLSIATGYSFCSLVGFPITSMAQAMLFVLIGIGVDDAFVLLGAFHQTQWDLALSERVRRMAEVAGPSIFVTSLTDVVAFGIGALVSTTPAVRIAGFYAVVGISIDFAYQITFFVALLVLDQHRMDAERRDYFPCCKARMRDTDETVRDEQYQENHAGDGGHKLEAMMRAYAGVILHPVAKWVIIPSFMALLVLGAVGASRLKVDLEPKTLMPRDSYIVRYLEANSAYFAGAGLTGALYMNGIDMSDQSAVESVHDFLAQLENETIIARYPSNFWLDDFLAYITRENTDENPLPPLSDLTLGSFVKLLDDFLGVEEFRRRHGLNIVRDSGSGELIASRVNVDLTIPTAAVASESVAFVHKQRDITLPQMINKNPTDNQIMPVFLYAEEFSLFENYRRMPGELKGSLITSAIAVAVIAVLFLPHISGVLLVTYVVIAVNIQLMGVIYAAGYTINTVTVMILIMAIGLVVDYTLHVVYSFVHCPAHSFSNRNERTEHSLVETGIAVFLGGLSTFLGTVVMAWAQGEAFRIYFVLFSSMVALGLGHGLVFSPVVLSIVGPLDDMQPFKKMQRRYAVVAGEYRPPVTVSSKVRTPWPSYVR